jgi:hypothetical protein
MKNFGRVFGEDLTKGENPKFGRTKKELIGSSQPRWEGVKHDIHSLKNLGLAARFGIPPFSVFDARRGSWQERKKAWLGLGIKSELGRGSDENGIQLIPGGAGENSKYILKNNKNKVRITPGGEASQVYTSKGKRTTNFEDKKSGVQLVPGGGGFGGYIRGKGARPDNYKKVSPGGSPRPAADYRNKARGDGSGKAIETNDLRGGLTHRITYDPYRKGETSSLAGGLTHGTTIHPYDGGESPETQSGTSIFDPVLCELAYSWFCPKEGMILDPFAGGSVRGIVAALLGYNYTGVDLIRRQVEENRKQAELICGDGKKPRWAVGDSMHIEKLRPFEADFIFSCPPYANLEVYSEDPRDISTMDYTEFIRVYREIILRSCALLKEDRFACFVVGDIRDKATGCYRGFPADTCAAFKGAGLRLYNEIILVTAVGSLPIRIEKQFNGYRKVGKTHQNVLVFVKGDPKKAAAAVGAIEVEEMFRLTDQ